MCRWHQDWPDQGRIFRTGRHGRIKFAAVSGINILQFTRAIRKIASSMLSAALQICYHTITNASRRSHCGGLESCRLRDPPQAKNPAKQDSFLLIEWRSLRSFPCTDSHASMESVHRKLRVNCNIKIGCICQKSLVHCRLISCDIF